MKISASKLLLISLPLLISTQSAHSQKIPQKVSANEELVNVATNLLLIGEGKYPTVIYVNADPAIGVRDGKTWETAWANIQEGIDSFYEFQLAEDNCCSIWIAEGTYHVRSGTTVNLRSNISLYGGFTGSETELSERNWETNRTIITGLLHNPLAQSQLFIAESVTNVRLDGLEMVGAHSDCDFYDASFGGRNGGALFSVDSQVTVENCTFTSNVACGYLYLRGYGGAIFSSGANGSLTIINSNFSGNEGDGSGGAIMVEDGDLSIVNSSFLQNSVWAPGGPSSHMDPDAGKGGAIRITGGSYQLRDLRFERNLAVVGFYGGVGGAVSSASSSGSIVNSVFSNNRSGYAGGALFLDGTVSIINSTFTLNQSDFHPAIRSSGSLINSIIWDNNPFDGNDLQVGGSISAVNNLIEYYPGHVFPGQDNINQDPMFINPLTGVFHLQSTSPCIDRANEDAPDYDKNGHIRVDGDLDGTITADLGAFEYVP